MKKYFIILFILLIQFYSCKREHIHVHDEYSLQGAVKHHDQLIPLAKVYIKFNTKAYPGSDTRNYDDSFMANKAAYYHYHTPNAGDAYLYAVGFDSSILSVVKGGRPLDIGGKNKELYIDIAVTE